MLGHRQGDVLNVFHSVSTEAAPDAVLTSQQGSSVLLEAVGSLLRSGDHVGVATVLPGIDLLLRIVGNVLSNPDELKFRRLRHDSKAVAKALPHVTADAWASAMRALGWERSTEDAGVWILPSYCCLQPLHLVRAALWEAANACRAPTWWQALPSVCSWLPVPDMLRIGRSCRALAAAEPAAAILSTTSDDMARGSAEAWARGLTLDLTAQQLDSAITFSLQCRPVAPGAVDPIAEFDEAARGAECVEGGDLRTGRVRLVQWQGFGDREFSNLVKMPSSLGAVDRTGRLLPVMSWGEAQGAHGNGWQYLAAVQAALRWAAWRHACGAQWDWTERASLGGRPQILVCRRIMWVFSSGEARWTLVVRAVQCHHM
eukprot:TRINITY_DN29207_c0_g1_i2.p1 TRINITY_DN29207_c0_g1~~TRINITY_DN29207_c0_g1_i2.p1  ORF type:complete len:372 (+),score=40.27 TRINITY_DN29207_c0_g1_i2:176-1291(+)